ncbi:MAG: hypothetical protein V4671_05280 [Armatimonadota bacterium]
MKTSTERRLFLGVLLFAVSRTTLAGNHSLVQQKFALKGIKKVIIRTQLIDSAKVYRVNDSQTLTVSGRPAGGAKGYHPSTPNWKETPADKAGLTFVSKRYGDVLVVSSANEFRYIHHYYYLSNITIRLPSRVVLVKQARMLSGDKEPDLRKP